MNWFDYVRGYDDGCRDGYNAHGGSSGLLPALLRLIFFLIVFSIRFAYTILRGLAALIWLIIKTIGGSKC